MEKIPSQKYKIDIFVFRQLEDFFKGGDGIGFPNGVFGFIP